MTMDQDSRLLVRFGDVARGGARSAWLIEDGAAADPPCTAAVGTFAIPATAHVIGCACCLPRGPVSVALGRLLVARARGEVGLFNEVVAVTHSQAGAAAVRAALEDDVVTRARFRLAVE
jgi:hypothetical protein